MASADSVGIWGLRVGSETDDAYFCAAEPDLTYVVMDSDCVDSVEADWYVEVDSVGD